DAEHLHGHVEVAHHTRDGRELLGVLAAVQGDVRGGEVHQLEHHGEHTVEVTGPGRALEDLTEGARAHAHGRVAVRVDHVRCGGEHDVRPDAREPLEVALEVARVPVEILARP